MSVPCPRCLKKKKHSSAADKQHGKTWFHVNNSHAASARRRRHLGPSTHFVDRIFKVRGKSCLAHLKPSPVSSRRLRLQGPRPCPFFPWPGLLRFIWLTLIDRENQVFNSVRNMILWQISILFLWKLIFYLFDLFIVLHAIQFRCTMMGCPEREPLQNPDTKLKL